MYNTLNLVQVGQAWNQLHKQILNQNWWEYVTISLYKLVYFTQFRELHNIVTDVVLSSNNLPCSRIIICAFQSSSWSSFSFKSLIRQVLLLCFWVLKFIKIATELFGTGTIE